MTTAKPRPTIARGEIRAYPVLPLRDIVVFPHVIVPLVEQEQGVRRFGLAHRFDDLARHRADIGPPMPADLRLVAHAAERHAKRKPRTRTSSERSQFSIDRV